MGWAGGGGVGNSVGGGGAGGAGDAVGGEAILGGGWGGHQRSSRCLNIPPEPPRVGALLPLFPAIIASKVPPRGCWP